MSLSKADFQTMENMIPKAESTTMKQLSNNNTYVLSSRVVIFCNEFLN